MNQKFVLIFYTDGRRTYFACLGCTLNEIKYASDNLKKNIYTIFRALCQMKQMNQTNPMVF